MSLNRFGSIRGLASTLRPSVLSHIAGKANISTTTPKKARINLPSRVSSATKWSNYAHQFGLPRNVSQLDLVHFDTFKTPSYSLPPSFHVAMFENAWRYQDVFRGMFNEEARLRILDPYLVPVVALFQGRVRDVLDDTMPETKYSTGKVDHEISMIDGTFFIIKFDIRVPDGNTIAKLFLDLLSTAELNERTDFAGLRIYGLLSDLTQFKFYSYDPATKRFSFDNNILVNNKRTQTLSNMAHVSNKIFGVILTAYINGLQASIAKNKDRVAHTNPSELIGKENVDRCKLIEQSEAALMLAESCHAKFEEPVANFRDIEEKGNEALALLTKSVGSIPRASAFSGGYDGPSLKPTELNELATRVIGEMYNIV